MAEKEKRRATTFRTSKGTIVNVAAPTVYVSPAFLSTDDVTNPTEMGEALREELEDLKQYSENSRENIPGTDTQKPGTLGKKFVGRVCVNDPATAAILYNLRPIDLTEYWTGDINGYGYFSLPENYDYLNARSKAALKYGYVQMTCVLPDFSIFSAYSALWLGFELGQNVGKGYLGYNLVGTALCATFGGGGQDNFVYITNKLPADWKTALHTYSVRIMKGITECRIDNDLAAVGVWSPGFSAFTEVATAPPYSVVLAPYDIPETMPTIVEMNRGNVTAPLRPAFQFRLGSGQVRFVEGDPNPPRVYRLYEAGTVNLLAGKTINAPITSHPFPIFGYEGKSIHFRSDTAATPATALEIEYYTQAGNWRVYSDEAVRANTLETFNLVGEGVLARIKFTPDSYPALITDAEVVLR